MSDAEELVDKERKIAELEIETQQAYSAMYAIEKELYKTNQTNPAYAQFMEEYVKKKKEYERLRDELYALQHEEEELEEELEEGTVEGATDQAGAEADEAKKGFADMLKSGGKKLGQYGKKNLKSLGADTKNKGKKLLDSENKGVALIFWIALVIHAIDVYNQFERTDFLYKNMMVLYAFVAVLAYFLVFRKEGAYEGLRHWFIFSALAAAYFFIPFLREYIPNTFSLFGVDFGVILNMIIILVPMWPIYIAKHAGYEQGLKIMWILWAIIIIGLTLYYVFSVEKTDLPFQDGSIQTKYPLKKLYTIVTGGITNLWNGLTTIVQGPVSAFNASMSRVTQPYYVGTVESNKNTQLGVTIEDIRPLHSGAPFFEGEQISATALLQGKTFESTVWVKNFCELQNGKQVILGTVYPDSVHIVGDDPYELQCIVPVNDGYTAINYSATSNKIVFESVFNYSTWGYVSHSFISRNLSHQLKKDIDINQKYNIPKFPQAIYTGGPVKLGLVDTQAPLEEPLPIDESMLFQQNRMYNLPYFFGVTIQNDKFEGKITRLRQLVLHVPKPLKLNTETCIYPGILDSTSEKRFRPTDTPEVRDSIERTYHSYVFENVDARADDKYVTVRCRLAVDHPDDITGIHGLLGETGISLDTFIVIADYDYILRKSEQVDLLATGDT